MCIGLNFSKLKKLQELNCNCTVTGLTLAIINIEILSELYIVWILARC